MRPSSSLNRIFFPVPAYFHSPAFCCYSFEILPVNGSFSFKSGLPQTNAGCDSPLKYIKPLFVTVHAYVPSNLYSSNTELLRALHSAILKSHNSSCKQSCVGFPTFEPWYYKFLTNSLNLRPRSSKFLNCPQLAHAGESRTLSPGFA